MNVSEDNESEFVYVWTVMVSFYVLELPR
jgi:hypothetical protein